MSHEMLTPLNSIIHLSGFVETKLKKKFKITGEKSGGVGSSDDD